MAGEINAQMNGTHLARMSVEMRVKRKDIAIDDTELQQGHEFGAPGTRSARRLIVDPRLRRYRSDGIFWTDCNTVNIEYLP